MLHLSLSLRRIKLQIIGKTSVQFWQSCTNLCNNC